MPGPNILVLNIREAVGNSQVGMLRGGLFHETIGGTGGAKLALGSTNDTPTNSVKRYRGKLYMQDSRDIRVYNPVTTAWDVVQTILTGSANPGGLWVVDTPTGDFLVALDSDNSTWWRFDGTTWVSDVNAVAIADISVTSIVYKGEVFVIKDSFGRIHGYKPETRTVTDYGTPAWAGGGWGSGWHFTLDDRYFVVSGRWTLTGGAAGDSSAFEFALGVFSDTGLAGVDWIFPNSGKGGALKVGDDVFLFGPAGANDATAGLKCRRYRVATPGGAISQTDFTTPVVPPALRGPGIGTPVRYKVVGFVDTVTNPGPPRYFLMFWPDSSISALPTLFEFIDETTELINRGSPDINGRYSLSTGLYGGGEFVNGIGTLASPLVTTSPRGNVKGATGVIVSFSAHGNALRVPHDAAGPAFTLGLVATQAPSGATGTIIEVGANHVLLGAVTGTWTNGQTFTDSGTGSAAQNAAATGGTADNTVTPRYHFSSGLGLGVPVSGVCSMVPGSGVGGTVVIDGGGAGVDQLQNVIADDGVKSFEWDFFSDSIPEGLIENIELTIVRP